MVSCWELGEPGPTVPSKFVGKKKLSCAGWITTPGSWPAGRTSRVAVTICGELAAADDVTRTRP